MQLVKRIQERFDRLSPSEQKVARYVVDAPDEIGVRAAADIARGAGVSEATAIRFAQSLGYPSYAEMKGEVQQGILRGRTLQLLASSSVQTAGEAQPFIRDVMLGDARLLERAAASIDPIEFETAIRLLLEARTIQVVGARKAGGLATVLSVGLQLFLGNATALVPHGGDLFDNLLRLESSDVVVVFSFRRYVEAVVNYTRLAGERGAKILLVTDHPLAPGVERADARLVVPVDTSLPVDSYVAGLSLVNALASAVALRGGDRVVRSLSQAEAILDATGAFHAGGSAQPAGPRVARDQTRAER